MEGGPEGPDRARVTVLAGDLQGDPSSVLIASDSSCASTRMCSSRSLCATAPSTTSTSGTGGMEGKGGGGRASSA